MEQSQLRMPHRRKAETLGDVSATRLSPDEVDDDQCYKLEYEIVSRRGRLFTNTRAHQVVTHSKGISLNSTVALPDN